MRLPLKPIIPALDQLIALPCASVMVIMVLLNEALTCAMPEPEAASKDRRMPFRRFLLRGPFLLKNVRSYRWMLIVRIMLGVWGFDMETQTESLGFMLFIFCVGIEAGPNFFSNFILTH